MTLKTRAVARLIEPGNNHECLACNKRIKYAAKRKGRQILCNIYENHKWNRLETFHPTCYEELGSPYGKVEIKLSRHETLKGLKRELETLEEQDALVGTATSQLRESIADLLEKSKND